MRLLMLLPAHAIRDDKMTPSMLWWRVNASRARMTPGSGWRPQGILTFPVRRSGQQPPIAKDERGAAHESPPHKPWCEGLPCVCQGAVCLEALAPRPVLCCLHSPSFLSPEREGQVIRILVFSIRHHTAAHLGYALMPLQTAGTDVKAGAGSLGTATPGIDDDSARLQTSSALTKSQRADPHHTLYTSTHSRANKDPPVVARSWLAACVLPIAREAMPHGQFSCCRYMASTFASVIVAEGEKFSLELLTAPPHCR